MDIEKYVEEQLQNVDITSIVNQVVRNEVKTEIYSTIKRLTERKITEIIEQEIAIALNTSVKTDDGWGKRNEYPNFDALFRETFAKKLNESWEMKKTIQKVVEARVSKLYEANKKEAINKVVDEIVRG